MSAAPAFELKALTKTFESSARLTRRILSSSVGRCMRSSDKTVRASRH